jgi:hypothetical protein
MRESSVIVGKPPRELSGGKSSGLRGAASILVDGCQNAILPITGRCGYTYSYDASIRSLARRAFEIRAPYPAEIRS